MDIDDQIVDSHIQKYDKSCIPSAIELILKLLGRADRDYYELQDELGPGKGSTFACYDGREIKGLTFHLKFPARGGNFPFEELFRTIDDELTAGRYVIISLGRPYTGAGPYHMYVIYGKTKDDYLAVSKDNTTTITLKNGIRSSVVKMGGTDILTYTI